MFSGQLTTPDRFSYHTGAGLYSVIGQIPVLQKTKLGNYTSAFTLFIKTRENSKISTQEKILQRTVVKSSPHSIVSR